MDDFIINLIDSLGFILQRLNWLSILDLLLVTVVFFGILLLLRDTQAMVLLRGVLLLIVVVSLLSSLAVLPAFSWLVSTTLPALVLAIPVIFAPEIRRALERLGRAGFVRLNGKPTTQMQSTVNAVVSAAVRLSDRRHGALIVIQRTDSLEDYIATGVRLDARRDARTLAASFLPQYPAARRCGDPLWHASGGGSLCDAAVGQRRPGTFARQADGSAPSRRPGNF